MKKLTPSTALAPLALALPVLLSGCALPGLLYRGLVLPVLGFLINAALFALNVWATYRVWTSRRPNLEKLMWTLVIWFIPVFGVLVYWFVGERGRS